jgi:hypothetical protein
MAVNANFMRKWNAVYKALKNSKEHGNLLNMYEKAFNNAENNRPTYNANAARNYFIANPNKRKFIITAYNKLSPTPARQTSKSPARQTSKFKSAVNRAVVHSAITTYVTNPSKLRTPEFKHRYQKIVRYLHNNPINIPVPLYRGVPKVSRFMPPKGNYNSGGRFLSFAKKLNTAKFFARRGGTVYVLPPGRYAAFNINANVKKRYPHVHIHRNLKTFPENIRKYIGYAKIEDEVFFAPGIFRVGNVRNNVNKSVIYKNISKLN